MQVITEDLTTAPPSGEMEDMAVSSWDMIRAEAINSLEFQTKKQKQITERHDISAPLLSAFVR